MTKRPTAVPLVSRGSSERKRKYNLARSKTKEFKEKRRLRRNAPDSRKQQNEYSRNRRVTLKIAAFNAYGGVRCACCRITQLEFLTIDHLDGGGKKHRLEIGRNNMYEWLKQNNYPPGYRVLCFNCNSALGAFGYCPHGDIRNDK